MRKVIFKVVFCFLVLILFFSSVQGVKAETYNHIYHITSLEVDPGNETLTFNGYAYIDHVDNYGGVNLQTWIIANNYEEQVTYEASDKYNYFYERCDGNFCYGDEHANDIRNGNLRRNNCNATGASDCAYFNVEFSVTLSLSELLNSSSDISFKIRTKTVVDAGVYEITSDLGVSKNKCKIKDQAFGSCNNKIAIGDDFIYINGLSDKVEVTATDARARQKIGDKFEPRSETFKLNGEFKFNDYISGVYFEKYGHVSTTNYYLLCGQIQDGEIQPSDSCNNTYYVYESWVKIVGSISINGSIIGDIPTSSGACDSGYSEATFDSKSVTCNGSQEFKTCVRDTVSTNVNYYLNASEMAEITNDETGKTCGNTVISTTLNADILLHQEGLFFYDGIADSVYAGQGFLFPSIRYYNRIYWRYDGNINDRTFNIQYGKWIKTETTKYKYVPRTEICGLAFHDDDGNPVGYRVGGGICNTGEQYTWISREYDGVEVTYKCEPTGNSKSISYANYKNDLNNAAKNLVNNKVNESAINGSTIKSYDSNIVSSNEKIVAGTWEKSTSDGTYNYEGSHYVTGYEFDMTDANIKLIGDDAGTIKYLDSTPNNYQHIGNRYFVPLLYPNNTLFPLNINKNNISFISGITWELDGSCSTKVENKVFDTGDPDDNPDDEPDDSPGDSGGGTVTPKFRYRSIDLSDPFPKSTPDNWKEWISKPENKNRLLNTYNKGFVYSVTLVSGNSSDGKLGINKVNQLDTDYNSWAGMSIDGVSQFVTNNDTGSYFSKQNTSSWCAIGKWDASCDR